MSEIIEKMFNLEKFTEAMKEKYVEKFNKYGDYRMYSIADIGKHLMCEIGEWMKTNDFNELVDIANCCAMIWNIIFDDETRKKNNYWMNKRYLEKEGG